MRSGKPHKTVFNKVQVKRLITWRKIKMFYKHFIVLYKIVLYSMYNTILYIYIIYIYNLIN